MVEAAPSSLLLNYSRRPESEEEMAVSDRERQDLYLTIHVKAFILFQIRLEIQHEPRSEASVLWSHLEVQGSHGQ